MGVQVNRQDTKAKDFQVKLNLPAKQAIDYQYGMQNNNIKLKIPLKTEHDEVTVGNNYMLDLNIKIKDTNTMDIDMMYIDIRSVLEVLKHLQGRV